MKLCALDFYVTDVIKVTSKLGRSTSWAINFFPVWIVNRAKHGRRLWLSHCSCICLFISLMMITYVHFYMVKKTWVFMQGYILFLLCMVPSVLTDVLNLIHFSVYHYTLYYMIIYSDKKMYNIFIKYTISIQWECHLTYKGLLYTVMISLEVEKKKKTYKR